MKQSTFLDRIKSGDTLISDGATGTNLHARGLPHGIPVESWLIEHPEEIIRLHQDFVDAGADILLTNTFGATPLRLEYGDLGGLVQKINQMAVELARKVAEQAPRQVYIAASMGPIGKLMKPLGTLEEAQVYESYLEQAKALSDTEIDLFVIETQFDMREAKLAFEAVRSVSSLPTVVSFSYDRGSRTMMGVTPAQMASEFSTLGADLLGINCGRSLEENLEALKALRASTQLPIWFKPNAGLPEFDVEGSAIYRVTPEEMGAYAPVWIAEGAQVIGGCCGTSPKHLAQIAQSVKRR